MVDPIIQLAIIIELILSICFAAPPRELQPFAYKQFLVKMQGVECLICHCTVEGRQYDRLGRIIFNF